MTIKLIGYSRIKDDYQIKQEFLERFNSTPKEQQESIKATLQKEYLIAVAENEADIKRKEKERYEHNLKAFIADPKGVIDELNELCRRSFDLGEMLISYGIAKTTIKRQGKGTLVNKGTIGEHIQSNFIVTARIGDETLSMALASSNDRRDKERSMSSVAAQLALKIAGKNA
jgi:hypothetical protein